MSDQPVPNEDQEKDTAISKPIVKNGVLKIGKKMIVIEIERKPDLDERSTEEDENG